MAFPIPQNVGASLVLVLAHFRAATRNLALSGFSTLSVTYIFVQRDAEDVGRIMSPLAYEPQRGLSNASSYRIPHDSFFAVGLRL